MEITDELRIKINIAVGKKYKHGFDFQWEKLRQGYSNDKWLLKLRDGTPLAIAKFYKNDLILPSEFRFENEKKALELFQRRYAPELITSIEHKAIVYGYIPGIELSNSSINSHYAQNILEILNMITDEGKATAKLEDVINFYDRLIKNYETLAKKGDEDIAKLKTATSEITDLIEQNNSELTYIHGDLVPANIIAQGEVIYLIDWEYFRTELPIFDKVYFNYYANKHNLSIRLDLNDVDKQLYAAYENLVMMLDKLWWKYCQLPPPKDCGFSPRTRKR